MTRLDRAGLSGLEDRIMEGIELLKRQACNPMWQRLQPYVAEAATPSGGGCNPMWQSLQPLCNPIYDHPPAPPITPGGGQLALNLAPNPNPRRRAPRTT